jgi:hypothetical protein
LNTRVKFGSALSLEVGQFSVGVNSLMAAVGQWPGVDEHKRLGGAAIAAWAKEHDMDHVLWTALGPKFGNVSGRQPASADEAVEYLRSRPPAGLAKAEEYVRKAPPQIRTPFRTAFEERLGWTPVESVG